MRSAKQPWQRGYLRNNWKFGHPQARTSRQAFGRNIEFTDADKADRRVFWICMVLAIVVLILEWLR